MPAATPAARRLRRKLYIRRLKLAQNLSLFDLDARAVESLLGSNDYQEILEPLARSLKPPMPMVPPNPTSTLTPASVLAAAAAVGVRREAVNVGLPRRFSFAERLAGRGGDASDSLTHAEVSLMRSSYTDRKLKPFIRRDFECRAPRLALLRSIPLAAKGAGERDATIFPIDYCYFRPEHLAEVNHMLSTFFWPGIEMSEALEHPEFTVVVCYRRLVIGCAFMTPGAYISYVLVHPHWRGGGIGRFMIYHLLQTISTKDVTLHVSATNPALLLYQEFGFKAEQFIVNFYDNYYPDGSEECKNALFLRRRR